MMALSYRDLLRARDGATKTVADVPCPICGPQHSERGARRKVMRTWFVDSGMISFNCIRCGEKGHVLPDDDHLVEPPPARRQQDDKEHKRKVVLAADLWRQREPIAGSVVETYLRDVRGITCPLPATLGFLPTWRDVPPRMIAACGLCDEPEPGVIVPPRNVQAVHLTYLLPDGSAKADVESPKQFRGAVKGKPIVVAPPNDLLGLAISEGIEDALSVHQATGLGAWAAGGATFMPALADAVPDYIEAVTVFAHDDPAGRAGAHQLAATLARRGIETLMEGM